LELVEIEKIVKAGATVGRGRRKSPQCRWGTMAMFGEDGKDSHCRGEERAYKKGRTCNIKQMGG